MSSMGDVIHTLPALSDAIKQVSNITLDWVVEEAFADIPGWHEAINQVIPIAIRRWRKNPMQAITSKEWQNFYRKLRATEYDYVIDAQGLIKSAVITKLARGASCGMDSKTARESIAAYLYRNKYHIPKRQHAIQRTRLLFAQALGYASPLTAPEYAIKKFKYPASTIDGEYLVFVHGTSRDEKSWPLDNWVELAQLVNQTGYKVVLPWGNEHEHEIAMQIADICIAEILPRSSLDKIAAVMLNAAGVIAVDTGLGHLAAALSVPAVSLYGATDPFLIGTMGANQQHIYEPSGLANISAAHVWQTLTNTMALKDRSQNG
jgi:heptosyltransferase I